MEIVTLWRGPREVQMREVDVNVSTISMVFQLLPSTIYLLAENGLVLVGNEMGYIPNMTAGLRYEVVGNEARPVQPPPQPMPFLNRPVAAVVRPRPPPQPRTFIRKITIGTIEGTGIVDSGNLYVRFTEMEANVPTMSRKVAQDLGVDDEIILCDCRGNRILEGIGTTGLSFWRMETKILALRQGSFEEIVRHRRNGNADNLVAANVQQLLDAAQELPAIDQALRYGRDGLSLTTDEITNIRSTFQCLICRDIIGNPVVSRCCRSLIGCQGCVSQMAATSRCPKCRHEDFAGNSLRIPVLGLVADLLRNTIMNNN